MFVVGIIFLDLLVFYVRGILRKELDRGRKEALVEARVIGETMLIVRAGGMRTLMGGGRMMSSVISRPGLVGARERLIYTYGYFSILL